MLRVPSKRSEARNVQGKWLEFKKKSERLLWPTTETLSSHTERTRPRSIQLLKAAAGYTSTR